MTSWVVIVTDRQLLPLVSGNRLRILGLIRAFRELGWKVGLVTVRGAAAPEELRPLVDELLLVRAQPFRGGDFRSFDPGRFAPPSGIWRQRYIPRLSLPSTLGSHPRSKACRLAYTDGSTATIFSTSVPSASMLWVWIHG